MGSLSPKTRNSQVELYQSGDVDYLVATDAIGMGLNMDINQIYFSNLKKFDGKKTRRLNLVEISQIAGRAGRYKNDGQFGTTGDCENFNSDEIEKIELHNLPETKILYWRNSDLNFESPEKLIAYYFLIFFVAPKASQHPLYRVTPIRVSHPTPLT